MKDQYHYLSGGTRYGIWVDEDTVSVFLELSENISPTEAREIAQDLLKAAEEAEAHG